MYDLVFIKYVNTSSRIILFDILFFTITIKAVIIPVFLFNSSPWKYSNNATIVIEISNKYLNGGIKVLF